MPDSVHLNGRIPVHNNTIIYNVSSTLIRKVLSTKNGRSSPGPSTIRYLHLSLLMEAAPDFMTDMVNEQLNSTEAPVQWRICTVIPIYKASKGLPVEDVSAFRSVILQESTAKLVSAVWLEVRMTDIIQGIGRLNHAYKPKHGVHTALLDLNRKISDMKRSSNSGGVCCM
jgi:hypothetical protein